MSRLTTLFVCLMSLLLLSACAPNMTITPELTAIPTRDFVVKGNLDYQGNAEYLPRTVCPDKDPTSTLTMRYRYEVKYGRDLVPAALPFFNPLKILGFPIGADTVLVSGVLDVLEGASPVKQYSAVCMLDKHRTLFSEGETLTEIRRRGLLAVRDNIETQMYLDRNLLLNLGH